MSELKHRACGATDEGKSQRRSLADERIETRLGCLVCFIFDVRDEVSLMSELKLVGIYAVRSGKTVRDEVSLMSELKLECCGATESSN